MQTLSMNACTYNVDTLPFSITYAQAVISAMTIFWIDILHFTWDIPLLPTRQHKPCRQCHTQFSIMLLCLVSWFSSGWRRFCCIWFTNIQLSNGYGSQSILHWHWYHNWYGLWGGSQFWSYFGSEHANIERRNRRIWFSYIHYYHYSRLWRYV